MKQTWEGPEEKNIFVIVVIRHLFEKTVLRPTHSLILKERSDLHVRSAIIQQITADHWKCMRSSTLGQNYTHVINAKSPMQQLVIWKLTCSRTQTRNHTSAQFVNIQPLQPRLSKLICWHTVVKSPTNVTTATSHFDNLPTWGPTCWPTQMKSLTSVHSAIIQREEFTTYKRI